MSLAYFVKNIEKVTISNMTGTTAQATLSNITDINDAIPFVTTRADSSPTRINALNCDVYFSESGGTNYINLERKDSTGTLEHIIYVIEFDTTYVNVYQGTCSIPADTQTGNNTITSIDTNKAFALVWAMNDLDTNNLKRQYFWWRFTSSTNLEMKRGEPDTSMGAIDGHYFIAEAKNDEFAVDHVTISTDGIREDTSTDFIPGRSLLIGSHYADQSSTRWDEPYYMNLAVQNELPGSVKIERRYSYGSYTIDAAIQTVTFKKDTIFVYGANLDLTGSDTTYSGAINPINNFNNDYCVPTWGRILHGKSDSTTADDIDCVFSTLDLYDNGVVVQRGASGSATLENYAQVMVFDLDSHGFYGGPETKAQEGLVRSIERVEGSMTIGVKFVELTKGQNIDDCIILPTWWCDGADNGMDSQHPTFGLTTGPALYASRQTDSGSVHFSAYVIEFNPNKVRVESGIFLIEGGQNSTDVSLSTIIRDDKTFVIGTDATTATTNCYNFQAELRWATTSGLQPYRYGTGNAIVSGNYFVVQAIDDDFKVNYVTDNTGGFDTSFDGNNGGPDQEFPIDNARCLQFQDFSVDTSSSYPSRTWFKCWLAEDGSWNYLRGSGSGNVNYTLYQIMLHDRYAKYMKSMSMLNEAAFTTETEFTIDLPDYYDPSRTIVYNPSRHCSNYNYDNSVHSDTWFRWYLLPDGLTVTGTVSNDDNSNLYYSARITQLPPPYTHYFEGYTKELGSPVSRTVRAYRIDTGEFVGETTSSGSNGHFRLETTWSGAHDVICLDDEAGVDYNDVIYGRMVPEPINSYI